ncbi:phage tail tube protein [Escherichia coli]|uniref:phage major tail tube protein n=1 Tax=Escherichia coli TaxID=562 RepID=UPI0010CC6C3A|nr:phage major tail tube protein [Escherichia coli]EHW5886098.1 phage major tail tube protein [Escherichia coli]GCZ36920.1 phage tail tube protein [Escherichia coli]GCZ73189.1 phage tail tube protein [Escherichia coli]HAJ2181040.1 phage major tail tube protein [Escherichia coli]HAJ2395169.1 phage major tail tube protein [Escherichia coli]
MAVPRHIRQFTLFVDGKNFIGTVSGLTPPKLTRKTEAYRGAGMLGAVNIDLGLDDGALDASFTTGGVEKELLSKYAGKVDEVALRFVGEVFTDGEESQILEMEMRGRITEIDQGEIKQGEATQFTFAVKNTYYKESIDDSDVVEIDLLNFIYKKDGQNVFGDRVSSALGLN